MQWNLREINAEKRKLIHNFCGGSFLMRQVVLINTKNIWLHNVVTLNISGAWFFTKSKVIVYQAKEALHVWWELGVSCYHASFSSLEMFSVFHALLCCVFFRRVSQFLMQQISNQFPQFLTHHETFYSNVILQSVQSSFSFSFVRF